MPQRLVQIAVVGGPGGGKTSFLEAATDFLAQRGWKAIVVPEVVTLLFDSNIDWFAKPPTPEADYEFQRSKLLLQLNLQEHVSTLAAHDPAERVVIIYDRGIHDLFVYGPTVAERLLEELEHSRAAYHEHYDAVLYLESAARIDGCYDQASNPARSEDRTVALALDQATFAAWCDHPHLKVVPAMEKKADKLAASLAQLQDLLAEPAIEAEKKYLFEAPLTLPADAVGPVHIIQTYLDSPPGTRRRVRSWSAAGSTNYLFTEKTKLADGTRSESERFVTKAEYDTLLLYADPTRVPLTKDRWFVLYGGARLEIDHLHDHDLWFLEIEGIHPTASYTLPVWAASGIDVSTDPQWKMSRLAKQRAEALAATD